MVNIIPKRKINILYNGQSTYPPCKVRQIRPFSKGLWTISSSLNRRPRVSYSNDCSAVTSAFGSLPPNFVLMLPRPGSRSFVWGSRDGWISWGKVHSLKLTQQPLKQGRFTPQKETSIYSNHPFSGARNVSFREVIMLMSWITYPYFKRDLSTKITEGYYSDNPTYDYTPWS